MIDRKLSSLKVRLQEALEETEAVKRMPVLIDQINTLEQIERTARTAATEARALARELAESVIGPPPVEPQRAAVEHTRDSLSSLISIMEASKAPPMPKRLEQKREQFEREGREITGLYLRVGDIVSRAASPFLPNSLKRREVGDMKGVVVSVLYERRTASARVRWPNGNESSHDAIMLIKVPR